jgi:hypothetical protein
MRRMKSRLGRHERHRQLCGHEQDDGRPEADNGRDRLYDRGCRWNMNGDLDAARDPVCARGCSGNRSDDFGRIARVDRSEVSGVA